MSLNVLKSCRWRRTEGLHHIAKKVTRILARSTSLSTRRQSSGGKVKCVKFDRLQRTMGVKLVAFVPTSVAVSDSRIKAVGGCCNSCQSCELHMIETNFQRYFFKVDGPKDSTSCIIVENWVFPTSFALSCRCMSLPLEFNSKTELASN